MNTKQKPRQMEKTVNRKDEIEFSPFVIIWFLWPAILWCIFITFATWNVADRSQASKNMVLKTWNFGLIHFGQLLVLPIFLLRIYLQPKTLKIIRIALFMHLTNVALRMLVYVICLRTSFLMSDHIFLAISLSAILQYELGALVRDLIGGYDLCVVWFGAVIFFLNLMNSYVTSKYYHRPAESWKAVICGFSLFFPLGIVNYYFTIYKVENKKAGKCE